MTFSSNSFPICRTAVACQERVQRLTAGKPRAGLTQHHRIARHKSLVWKRPSDAHVFIRRLIAHTHSASQAGPTGDSCSLTIAARILSQVPYQDQRA